MLSFIVGELCGPCQPTGLWLASLFFSYVYVWCWYLKQNVMIQNAKPFYFFVYFSVIRAQHNLTGKFANPYDPHDSCDSCLESLMQVEPFKGLYKAFKRLLKALQKALKGHLKTFKRPFKGLLKISKRPSNSFLKAFWIPLKGLFNFPKPCQASTKAFKCL